MANNLWSNYTEKTATPVDADEVMVRDSTDRKNKRLLFGTFWKWIAKKLNEATISELQTSNKTIVGALNQLNSKRLCMQQVYENGVWNDCNNIPTGETAIAFDSAKNKPLGNNTWFIFCMGSVQDNIKYQLAISYMTPFSVKARIYDSATGNWLDWK